MSALYDQIGDGYDTTRRADPAIVHRLAAYLALAPGQRYLDVGCGTGNYTAALAALGGVWHGVDPSRQMLAAARAKAPSLAWREGSAEALPFDAAVFDGVLCMLSIHHFTDLPAAFAEIGRVLRPGGRAAIFTATPEQVRRYWVNHYFPEMMARDYAQLPAIERMAPLMAENHLGLTDIAPFFITADTADFFFYSGKLRPEMYLSEDIRAGMSCFRARISDAELAGGLARLAADIADRSIDRIIAESLNDIGDYCFIAMTRAAA